MVVCISGLHPTPLNGYPVRTRNRKSIHFFLNNRNFEQDRPSQFKALQSEFKQVLHFEALGTFLAKVTVTNESSAPGGEPQLANFVDSPRITAVMETIMKAIVAAATKKQNAA